MLRTATLASMVSMMLYGAHAACDDLTLPDGDPWHDDGGTKYNCAEHYKTTKKCTKDGSKYAFEGLTANTACCACGGGTEPAASSAPSSGDCAPDNSWEHPQYGDTCADYLPGGKSNKYWCKDDKAQAACGLCSCGQAAAGPCTPDNDWQHATYGDTCADYAPGGKAEQYGCDAIAKEKCCTCGEVAKDTGSCTDTPLSSGEPWHDKGGDKYDCAHYGKKTKHCKNDGDKYDFEGMTANQACCACGGGQAGTCTDQKLPGGELFHDSGGKKYNCAYYSAKPESRCKGDGDKYAVDGLTANMACCGCGGGDDEGDMAVKGGEPQPGSGDQLIGSEWMGGVAFKNKKHLAGDMVLYWNTDTSAKTITMGLLGPEGWTAANRYIALGISPNGAMAGSDAVAAYFDDDGEGVIVDMHLKNQAPTGVKVANRQKLTQQSITKHGNRLGFVFKRPWVSEGVELRPTSEYTQLLYTMGKINVGQCRSPVCNHVQDERWMTEVALTAPPGMLIYTLNRGLQGEPCQGPAKLECQEGMYCVQEFGDEFAGSEEFYGQCKDPTFFGADPTDDDYDDGWSGVQNVFTNGGGFTNEMNLQGGFVLMWDVDKVSKYGSVGPDDFITVALVSTTPSRQGYIGFGFSPNGYMKGSDVVVGWVDEGVSHVYDYFLEKQVSSENKPSNKQELINPRVIFKNGQTAITFTRPLTPRDSVQLIEGDVHVIYASGPLPENYDDTQWIPYHRYRNKKDVTFIPLEGDLGEANKVGEMELCSGPANVLCKTDLTCLMFPPEMFEIDWSEAMNDTSGFTSNSDWGHGGRGGTESPFSNMTALKGRGICLQPSMAEAFGSLDMSKLGQTQTVDPEDYSGNQKLRFGMELYWQHLEDDHIRIALVSSIGPGWVGFGFSDTGAMIGSSTVCGWKSYDEEESVADEYYLNDKLPWEIKSLTRAAEEGLDHAQFTMGATNMKLINAGHENALVFERPLNPPNGVAPITPGQLNRVIFAVGNVPNPVDDYFGYHRFRDVADVTFAYADEA